MHATHGGQARHCHRRTFRHIFVQKIAPPPSPHAPSARSSNRAKTRPNPSTAGSKCRVTLPSSPARRTSPAEQCRAGQDDQGAGRGRGSGERLHCAPCKEPWRSSCASASRGTAPLPALCANAGGRGRGRETAEVQAKKPEKACSNAGGRGPPQPGSRLMASGQKPHSPCRLAAQSSTCEGGAAGAEARAPAGQEVDIQVSSVNFAISALGERVVCQRPECALRSGRRARSVFITALPTRPVPS